MSEQPLASHDWFTLARCTIVKETVRGSVSPWRQRRFHVAQELELIQWGNEGRPVDRSRWWTSYDIDAAFIISSDYVEVVEILDEVLPN